MSNQVRDRHFVSGKKAAEALLSRRRYSVLVTIIEVFFRQNMGERYFNGRNFFGGLVALIILRYFLAWGNTQTILFGQSFASVHYFDVFAVLYVLLSLYHFTIQWRKRAAKASHYSYYLGDSRWFFLAKGMRFRDYRYVTYYFVEPLMVLFLALPVLLYSFFLGILTALAALRLWWENAAVLAQERQEALDRQDSEIYAKHVRRSMAGPKDLSEKNPIHAKTPKPTQPGTKEKYPDTPQSSVPSVEDALEKLDPKLKNLGK